ncbi:hypothetical protein VCHENC02_0343A, partial [Vibrio harveyi]
MFLTILIYLSQSPLLSL